MNTADHPTVFVDTSIVIGRRVHRWQIRKSIDDRLAEFEEVVSGLQVRNEFKRRLLKEAAYLLAQLTRRGSFEDVRRHVQDSKVNERKKQISLQITATVDEKRTREEGGHANQGISLNMIPTIDEHDTPEDRTDRLRFYLRRLLRSGLKTFDAEITRRVDQSGCVCALHPVIETKRYEEYDFGPIKCSKAGEDCRIVSFLLNHKVLLIRIAEYLASLTEPAKTTELKETQSFIIQFLADPQSVRKLNPCTVVGDLLIALESYAVSTFYTMNYKESQHLCKVLEQRLIYRNPNSDHPEVDCPVGNEFRP